VANKQLWHWQGSGIVGRDLNTGKLTTTLDTSDVFTPGHHPRCYQSKATENFIITPYRGAEFISVTGQANTQNDWLRGPCRYGIMPGNGLLYVGPNPCFCYPGVKLIGFNALAPAATGPAGELLSAERLTRGGAYQEAKELARSRQGNAENWRGLGKEMPMTGRPTVTMQSAAALPLVTCRPRFQRVGARACGAN
jgi:hypothetical protein